MYQSITELPQPALQLLDPTQQEMFRSSYNLAEIETKDPQQALQKAWSTALSATGESNRSYLIDVSSMQFEEGTDGIKWFQAFPYGKWHHPLYGEIKMTPEDAQLMVKQFKEGVVGQDLDIDYDHKMHHGGAAGWVKDAEVRQDGVYLAVNWTKDALDKIKNKVYRYFSPEYADKWKHPVTQQEYRLVLRGGALTNRPFLKGLQPINLSEAIDVGVGNTKPELIFNTQTGGRRMPMSAEQLATARKNLGLPDTADESAVTAAALERATVAPPTPPAPPAPTTIAAHDREAIIALAEENPIVKKLVDGFAALESSHRLSEINHQLSAWQRIEGDRKWGLPTVLNEKLRTFMLSEAPQRTTQLTEIINTILEKGLVKLDEANWKPGDRQDGSTYDDPAKLMDEEARKLMEADKSLEYQDAIQKVSNAKPELAKAYFLS